MSYHIFDTHTHMTDASFDPDREERMLLMFSEGVVAFTEISDSMASSRRVINFAKAVREADDGRLPQVFAAVGVHPEHASEINEDTLDRLEMLASDESCVAIGEIGLDYHFPDENPSPEIQRRAFRLQLRLAKKLGLPVNIHSRDAAKDTMDILREEDLSETGGILHCFSYSPEVALEAVKMNFYIGLGGVVTFKNARRAKETAAALPLDRIVTETDSPYMAPEPVRGSRNDPGNLPYVIRALAACRGISEQEMADAAFENALTVYGL